MKKIFLSISIISLVAVFSSLHAQGIGVGIKAGVNFSNQSIKALGNNIGNINTDGRTGFNGGAYVVLAFSEKWAVQPEVLYSVEGSEIPEFNQLNQLEYLSVPILLRWKPLKLLSFEAGPQFSTLLAAKDIDGDSVKDNFKNSDFGLVIGATVHLPLGFNVGARYIWGFTNVSDLDIIDMEVKNTVGQIFAGWTIFGAN
jgi:hypothetical protein